MTLDLHALDALVLEPRAAAVNHNDHFVEIYDDDAALAASVRTFISMGINDGEAGVVIATPRRRAAIEAELDRVVDLAEARHQGVLAMLDAAATLSHFMDAGEVDRKRFEEVVGDVLERAGRGGRRIRVFGEMVALLWEQGNVTAALELEDCWNDLAHSYDFRLYCAYPTTAFGAEDTSALTGVCNRHSHVVVPPA